LDRVLHSPAIRVSFKAHVRLAQLIVICGPPLFERTIANMLSSLGYLRDSYYFFSQDN
jgi:hypothetical protein